MDSIKKFINLFLILYFYNVVGAFSQNLNWQWGKAGKGETFNEIGKTTAIDNNGNVYACGEFYPPRIIFGIDTLFTISENFFLVKYDPGGNVLWAKTSPSVPNSSTRSFSVTTDINNNVFLTGTTYQNSLDFGNNVILTFNTTSSKIFLAKFDSSGNCLWAKSAQGVINNIRISNCISTDLNGSVYMAGYFNPPCIFFDTDTIYNNALNNNDIFIAKYDSSGTFQWAKGIGGSSHDQSYSIATDLNNNIYLSAEFSSPYLVIGTDTIINTGGNDILLVKFDSGGNQVWMKHLGDASYNNCQGIATDNNGNIYMTGSFYASSIVFGQATLFNSSTGSDAFLFKYDSSGTEIWAKCGHGSQNDFGFSVAVDQNNVVYLIGKFYSPTITFDSVVITNPPVNYHPFYIVSFNSSGNILCYGAMPYGGFVYNSIVAGSYGNVYVKTDFYYSGQYIIGNDTIISGNFLIDLIAKFNCELANSFDLPKDYSDFQIFPNPAFESVTVSGLEPGISHQSLKIYNVYGKKIYSKPITSTVVKLQISNFPSGIYFVKIDSSVKKIIKIN